MIIVADTSALHAAFDSAQPEHSGAAKILADETLAISRWSSRNRTTS